MLLRNMTFDEVRKEFFRDFPAVVTRAKAEIRFFRAEIIRNHLHHSTKVMEYTSAGKNRWLFIISGSKGQSSSETVLYYGDEHGIVTYSCQEAEGASDLTLAMHTGHFFRRYNERLKLGLEKPLHRVKHFFKHNFSAHFIVSEAAFEGKRLVTGKLATGLALGYCTEEQNLYVFKTFVTFDMAHENQKQIIQLINNDEAEAGKGEKRLMGSVTEEQLKDYLG